MGHRSRLVFISIPSLWGVRWPDARLSLSFSYLYRIFPCHMLNTIGLKHDTTNVQKRCLRTQHLVYPILELQSMCPFGIEQ